MKAEEDNRQDFVRSDVTRDGEEAVSEGERPESRRVEGIRSEGRTTEGRTSDDGCLTIDRLRLRNFRSYRDFELDDIGPLTLFVGPNASGKTNVIEGVQLLTATTSFRSSRSSDLISWGSDQALLDAHMTSAARSLDVGLVIDEHRKTWRLNGKTKQRQDIQGLLPSVTFSPDDLVMVKGSHVHRRDAVDTLGCQLTRNYRVIKRDYEKLLRHKHALLEDGIGGTYLESVNETIIPVATQLCLNRYALLRNLSGKISETYCDLAGTSTDRERVGSVGLGEGAVGRGDASGSEAERGGIGGDNVGGDAARRDGGVKVQVGGGEHVETFTQVTVPSWYRNIPDGEFYHDRCDGGAMGDVDLNVAELGKDAIEDALRRAFGTYRGEELERKRCLVGPQADRIFFYIDGKNATHFASQGQQRSIVLAWKIAEVRIIQEILGTRPVLLLDDVTSELDITRRNALMTLVSENIQTFMTTTDVTGVDPQVVARARVIDLGAR